MASSLAAPGVAALVAASNLPVNDTRGITWGTIAADPANHAALKTMASKRSKTDVHILYARALRECWLLEQALAAQSLLPASFGDRTLQRRTGDSRSAALEFGPGAAAMNRIVAVHPSEFLENGGSHESEAAGRASARSARDGVGPSGSSLCPARDPGSASSVQSLAVATLVDSAAVAAFPWPRLGGLWLGMRQLPWLLQRVAWLVGLVAVLCPSIVVHLCFAWLRSFWTSASSEVVDTVSAGVSSVAAPMAESIHALVEPSHTPYSQYAAMFVTFVVARFLPH